MEKDQKKSLVGVVAICAVALLILVGIGYAAFSTTLKINGAATVKGGSSWKVYFKSLATGVTTGSATEVTAPEIDSAATSIGDYSVTFTKPGDSISYTFVVENSGSINALVSNVSVPTPTCTGTEGAATATTDATNVCDNIKYTLTYEDGTAVSNNDTLDAKESKTMKLTLTYGESLTDTSLLPTSDVTVSGLQVSVIYSQN